MADDPIQAVLRMLPYGFYSITSRSGEEVNIMVANWLTQVSFEPRLVALGLQKTSFTHSLVEAGRVFAVNVFSMEDSDIISQFTKSRAKNPDKVEEASFTPGPETGCPILDKAAAYLEVRVSRIIDIGGDHDLIVGEVVGAGVRTALEPTEVLSLPGLGWSYAG
jgi:flavin reductase (DIM6/NTAB) family NADH-FMN oxidoreductase RutF